MEFIDSRDVLNQVHIEGWKCSKEYGSGSIIWYRDISADEIADTDFFYATPNWDEQEGKVPFNAWNDDGDEIFYEELQLVGSINDQINQYEETAKRLINKHL